MTFLSKLKENYIYIEISSEPLYIDITIYIKSVADLNVKL